MSFLEFDSTLKQFHYVLFKVYKFLLNIFKFSYLNYQIISLKFNRKLRNSLKKYYKKQEILGH